MAFRSVSPATGEVLETFEELLPESARQAAQAAQEAFHGWRRTPVAERAALLHRAAGLLRGEPRAAAELMALEMGKPVSQGEREIAKCAWVCEYYAERGEAFLAPESVETDAVESGVRFEPLGPVLAIMPWNFPWWQVFRFAAPALLAGNAGLLKHAPNVLGCARGIERLLHRAGLPEGVFQSLPVSDETAGALIDHPAGRAVTLTGSEAAGRSVGERAGRALKKAVLELGGSDPFVVLDDADVPAVAREAARSRTLNSGQSCIAAKRFLVAAPLRKRFIEALADEIGRLRVGDPLDADTQIGPLAREDLRDALDRQVRGSVEAGAQLVAGGRPREGPGFFYEPTVLADVRPGMPAFDEETFGPVAAVTAVASDAEAVALANRSRFGLGASVWSGDPERARRLVPEIEAGHVSVNGIVKSDPRLPFGGVKHSGHGRELGRFGIREFVNVKTVWVGAPRGGRRP